MRCGLVGGILLGQPAWRSEAFVSGVAGRWASSRPGHTALRVHTKENPWTVLGLAAGASQAEVKARFKQLVRQYHPDLTDDGSSYLLQRAIVAAETILKGQSTAREATKEGAPAWHSSRTRKKDEEWDDVLLYMGRGRIHRGSTWANYKITMGVIEVTWPMSGYMRTRGSAPMKRIRYQEVRRIAERTDLEDGRVDLQLELVGGMNLPLEQLPKDVVAQIERIVLAFEARAQAMRATMLHRCV